MSSASRAASPVAKLLLAAGAGGKPPALRTIYTSRIPCTMPQVRLHGLVADLTGSGADAVVDVDHGAALIAVMSSADRAPSVHAGHSTPPVVELQGEVTGVDP
ncbi:hypothetical protein MMPV_008290 [Pyropia vietnamensis]